MARVRNHYTPELIDRNVSVDPSTGCWNWRGDPKQRYPRVWVEGVFDHAHHVSYKIFHGDLKESMYVMHECDNTRCVNPDHIRLGTPQENVLDSVKKGRFGGLKPKSKAMREKLSRFRTGQKASEATLQKMRARVHSEETRRKMSVSARNRGKNA